MTSSTLKQIWTVFGALLNLACCGFHLGYPTILFRDLKAEDSPIPLTLEMESWITSSVTITTLLSFLLVAPMMEQYGRKAVHLAVIIPNFVACIVFYFANSVTALVIARLTFGIPCGGTIVLNAIIIAEFTSPKIRGVLLNAKTSAIVFGAGFSHVLGLFFDWRMVALLGTIMPVASFLITLMWPESPAWLARYGHYERCEESFIWLRGEGASAQKELHALIQSERERRTIKILSHVKKPFAARVKKYFVIFTRRDFYKPISIMACVFVLLEACGRHVFPAYALKIVTAFTGGPSTLYYVVALDSVIFFTSVLACVVVNLFKRRTLLFSTGSVCCVLLLSICLCLYLKTKDILPKDNVWVPLTLLVLYFFFLNLGTSPIVLSLLGEIIPLKYRSMGVVMSGVIFSASLMTALKVTPAMIEAIEVQGTFTVFGLIMICCLLYLYYTLPETKDKTLQEIEEHFTDCRDKVKLTYHAPKDVRVDGEILSQCQPIKTGLM